MDGLREIEGEIPIASKQRGVNLLSEMELDAIEQAHPRGVSSRELIDLLCARGIRFSEATLRKYVQLGLLPRSVRVGCKGKHQGSKGIYPSSIVRRVNQVRAMMAANLTIEEIQKSFVRFKDEIAQVEQSLRGLIAGIEKETQVCVLNEERRLKIESEIGEAKVAAGELVRKLANVEACLTETGEGASAGTAVGGGSDLY